MSTLTTFLLSVPKLRKFQPSTAAELAACVCFKEVPPEEYVFIQGEPPEAYFILLAGTCALYVRDDDEDGLGVFLIDPGLHMSFVLAACAQKPEFGVP